MTHRERFHKVVMHEETDRIVFDLCGSPQTEIDGEASREDLRSYLGISGEKQGFFQIDEQILKMFDIDTRKIGGMPTPTTIHNREENGVRYDSYGIGFKMINGHYEICHNPLRDAGIDEVLAYPMPEASDIDQSRIRQWADDARYLCENTDYAIIGEHPFFGVFEIGCWMFGFDDYLYRLAAEPELVHAFSKRILQYQKDVVDMYYAAIGPYIDCTTSGDDFGMQTGPFLSLNMFQELILPYFKERIAYTRKYTDAFFKHHTCGSVHDFIPDFIAAGVDILNPVQPGTYMMEPDRLKKDFGNKITFWGAIDTQDLLPNGTVEEIKAEVARILSIMAPGGGYILAPAHCIQPDVPVANIAAIYQGAKEYYN